MLSIGLLRRGGSLVDARSVGMSLPGPLSSLRHMRENALGPIATIRGIGDALTQWQP
jgi:hypothetical protein